MNESLFNDPKEAARALVQARMERALKAAEEEFEASLARAQSSFMSAPRPGIDQCDFIQSLSGTSKSSPDRQRCILVADHPGSKHYYSATFVPEHLHIHPDLEPSAEDMDYVYRSLGVNPNVQP